jgi:FGGY-family pentulose kinase
MPERSASYLLTVDFGTESARAAIFDAQGKAVATSDCTYATYYPHGGWAEQEPVEWRKAFIEVVRNVVSASRVSPSHIRTIAVDTTCSTLCFLDEKFDPICRSILWMDVRSSGQARKIASSKHEALKYNGSGQVPADWMPSKILWVKENRPEIYRNAVHICEFIDWVNYLLTRKYVASINNVTARWYYDNSNGGWPAEFYETVGIGDLLDKVPSKVLRVGEIVGGIDPTLADEMGLSARTIVVQGGSDAYIGTLGLGVVHEGDVALITGSSHLLLGLTRNDVHSPSISGSFPDAVIPGLRIMEGSQISTGSVLKWFSNSFINGDITREAKRKGVSLYEYLDSKMADITIGSEGIIVLDHWQGNRNPYSDPLSRGVIWGLSLNHSPFHVYHAIMEGIAYGTKIILDGFQTNGLMCERLMAGGGITRSKVWMQIHSDVLGLPIHINEVSNVALLGCAVLSARAIGLYPSIEAASRAMVRCETVIEPDLKKTAEYSYYVEKYAATYSRMADLMNDMASRRSLGE